MAQLGERVLQAMHSSVVQTHVAFEVRVSPSGQDVHVMSETEHVRHPVLHAKHCPPDK